MKTIESLLRSLPSGCALILAFTLWGAEPGPGSPPSGESPDTPLPAQQDTEPDAPPPLEAPDPSDAPADAGPEPTPPPDEPPPAPAEMEAGDPPASATPSAEPSAAPGQPNTNPPSAEAKSDALPSRNNRDESRAGAVRAEVEPTSPASAPDPAAPVKPGEKGLRLNFRNVPLEMVLNYLSEAAGFIIVLETEVRGKVDVWSNQPLDQEEALALLNTVLNKNGYAALRQGRMLTVISRDDARKRDIPVITGANPEQIPRQDSIVTQILPVRFINAAQLSRDLAPLIPASASVAANDGGNALLITDTQTNIRRIAEIVRALDTSISSTYVIRVFALQFADAKSLATAIRDLFQSQDTSTRSNDPRAQLFNRFMGGGGGPGGDRGGGGGATGSASGRAGASRVVAVADERSNAVVVSAPEDVMPSIQDLVKAVDTEIEDVTELRVFHLKFADPQEMADLLSNLFPDTSNSQNNRGQTRFAGGRFGGFGQGGFGGVAGGASGTASSERLLKQTRVVAVPDPRTSSVVVSASRTLMEQIEPMVAQLDSDPAKKQKVFVYSVENTDPQAVQEVIQSLFPEQNYGNSSQRRTTTNARQNSNQLNNRQSQTRQGTRSNSGIGVSGLGTSGFGTTGGR